MADYNSFSDEELLSGGISADESGKLAALVSRYSEMVLLQARRYANSADYEELVSEGLDALLGAVSSYQHERGSFASFAGVCVSNRMRNVVDRASRKKLDVVSEEEFSRTADPAPTPEEMFLIKESTDAVSFHIDNSLTELERNCINGVIFGFSYDEIAQRLGVDRKSVDNAVVRARAKLKRCCPDIYGGTE